MSRKTHSFRVGLFVIAGTLLAGSCAVVLGGRGLFQEYTLAETYFEESVQGLEVGSAVKMRGVKLGTVAEIGFVENYYSFDSTQDRLRHGPKIVVRMKLNTQPSAERRARAEQDGNGLQDWVAEGLRMQLVTQPLMGTAYLEADLLDPTANPPMEIAWTPEILYIPSAPSTFALLSSAAERTFARLEAVQVEKVVTDLDRLILTTKKKLEQIDVPALQADLSGTFTELRTATEEFRAAMRQTDIAAVTEQTRRTLERMDGLLVRVREVVDDGETDVGQILTDLRRTAENLRDLSETAREYPAAVILGAPPERTDRETPP